MLWGGDYPSAGEIAIRLQRKRGNLTVPTARRA